MERYHKRPNKIIVCIDCHKEFEADSQCQTNRCPDCYKIYRRKQKTDTMRRLRSNK